MDDISVLAFFLGAILGMLLQSIFAPLLSRLDSYHYKIHLYIAGVAAVSLAVVFFLRAINAATGDRFFFPINQFLTLPLAPNFALGVIFGALAAFWFSYIRQPEKFKEEYVRVAHRRGGYALVFLAVIGIFYSTINRIVDNLQGLETPFGSVTIAQDPEKGRYQLYTRPQDNGEATGLSFTSTSSFFLERLRNIRGHITTDKNYIKIFKSDSAENLMISERHKHLDLVFGVFFQPLRECINIVMERAGDPEFLHANISELDHTFKSRPDRITLEKLTELLNPLLKFGLPLSTNSNGCTTLDELLKKLHLRRVGLTKDVEKTVVGVEDLQTFWGSQPYAAMVVAFLIGGAGAHETAILDLTKWLDQQYVDGKIKKLPDFHEWYIVRAQLYLEQILELLGYERARKEVLDENIALMQSIYSTAAGADAQYLRNVDLWRRGCEKIEDNPSIHALAFSLINQIDRRNAVALDIGQHDDALLESARKNAELDSACIAMVPGLDAIAAQDFRSQFDAHYGEMLVKLADDEVKRYRRLTNRATARYREAYVILQRAIANAVGFQRMRQKRPNPKGENPGLYRAIINQSREIEVRIDRAKSLLEHVVAQL